MTQLCKIATPKGARRTKSLIDREFRVELFKALSDPTRLLLLACLSKCGRACSLGEIAECCDVDLSVVSRHMAQLLSAGVVSSEKEGRTVYFRTNYRELAETFRSLARGFDECCPAHEAGECCKS